MAEKKYYWIKLKRDFFKRHDIKIVEAMTNGKDYILFYLKLLLESIDHEGELRFNDTIPYNEQMLSVITGTNVDIVKAAMKTFISLGMIEMFDDGTIFMTESEKMIGSESASAHRMRESRKRLKELHNNTVPSHCDTSVRNCYTEIEKEKDTEQEIEQDQERVGAPQAEPSLPPGLKPKKSARFIPPTLEEVRAFIAEINSPVDAEVFIDYYTSNGWKVGKTAMKDWRSTVRNWTRREKGNSTAPKQSGSSKNDLLKRLYEEARADDKRGNGQNNNADNNGISGS